MGQEAFLEKMGQDTNINIFYLRGSGGFWGGEGASGSIRLGRGNKPRYKHEYFVCVGGGGGGGVNRDSCRT